MKNLMILTLIFSFTFSAFANTEDRDFKAQMCAWEYIDHEVSDGLVIDYLNSRKALKLNMFMEDHPIAGTVIALPILMGTLVSSIVLAPKTIHDHIKGGRGREIYDTAKSLNLNSAYQGLLKDAQEINPGLSREQLDEIVLNGFAYEFCSHKNLASRNAMRKFIKKEVLKITVPAI